MRARGTCRRRSVRAAAAAASPSPRRSAVMARSCSVVLNCARASVAKESRRRCGPCACTLVRLELSRRLFDVDPILIHPTGKFDVTEHRRCGSRARRARVPGSRLAARQDRTGSPSVAGGLPGRRWRPNRSARAARQPARRRTVRCRTDHSRSSSVTEFERDRPACAYQFEPFDRARRCRTCPRRRSASVPGTKATRQHGGDAQPGARRHSHPAVAASVEHRQQCGAEHDRDRARARRARPLSVRGRDAGCIGSERDRHRKVHANLLEPLAVGDIDRERSGRRAPAHAEAVAIGRFEILEARGRVAGVDEGRQTPSCRPSAPAT